MDSELISEEKIQKEILVCKIVNVEIMLQGLNKDLNLADVIERKRDFADLQLRILGFRKPNPKVFNKNIFGVESRIKPQNNYLNKWILAHERTEISSQLEFAKFMERFLR